jgi:hypothetical protein
MTIATDAQVQNYVDTNIRPRCEQIRSLLALMSNDLSLIDDIYAALTQQTPTWTDSRTDAPPHLLTGNDILALNSLLNEIKDAIDNSTQKAVMLKACVRSEM